MKKISISKINVGDIAIYEKKVTLKMVKEFAKISEDYNPIHLDKNFAEKSRYKGQIAHGLIAASLFSGIFGTQLPGIGCVYKSQKIKFKYPVYIDDIVKAKITVIKKDSKKTILFSTKCFVKNKTVIDGESEIFVP